MSKERKYPEGFMHLSFLLPVSMVRTFEDFCEKFHISQTDALHIAINFCAMSAAEREQKLNVLAFECQGKDRIISDHEQTISRLNSRLATLEQKPVRIKTRSVELDKLVESTNSLLERGDLSKVALETRLEQLRSFLSDSSIPDRQKDAVMKLMEKMRKTSVDNDAEQLRIKKAEAHGYKGAKGPDELPIAFYDFTKSVIEKKRGDSVFEELMNEADKKEAST